MSNDRNKRIAAAIIMLALAEVDEDDVDQAAPCLGNPENHEVVELVHSANVEVSWDE